MDQNYPPEARIASSENLRGVRRWRSPKTVAIFILVVGVIFLGVGSYVFYKYSQTQKNLRLSLSDNQSQILMSNAACSLSGQTAQAKNLGQIETQFVDVPWGATKRAEVIARVLNTEPFVIEILDRSPYYPSYAFELLGLQDNLAISQGDKRKTLDLKLNDIISANLYVFSYPSTGLDIAGSNTSPPPNVTALKDIKRIEGQVDYFNSSPDPFVNRSGTLVRYVGNAPTRAPSNGQMWIFNDRKVYYRDYNGNVLTNKQLTEQELEDLLKLFAQLEFDTIVSDFSVSRYSPSLSLICSRYQPIFLSNPRIKPVTDKLDSIIDSYRNEATKKLIYSKKYAIKDWEYESVVSLGEASKSTFMGENRARLSQMIPPQSLLDEAGMNRNNPKVFYREDGKIYGVYFESCADGLNGTWGCFRAESVEELGKGIGSGTSYYKMWPSELSMRLKDVGPNGMMIAKEDYLNEKVFYDKLWWQDDYPFFREGDYLYQRVQISLE